MPNILILSLLLIAPPLQSAENSSSDSALIADAVVTERRATEDQFLNPIAEGADPWVINNPLRGDFAGDPRDCAYLWCLSEGNRALAIHTSDRLTSLGQKHIVWQAPESGPASREVWAPELHFLDDRWYIYFAASDGKNENHLAWVLASETSDPLSEYRLHGPLATGDGSDGRSPNIWAIDMTVLELADQRYALWSGWDAPGTDRQFLYIAPMKSPTELAGPRVRLCDNDDHLWERLKPLLTWRGLHEAPQVFQTGGVTSVVYSCGASWLPSYKLGMLELVGADPLDPKSWRKHSEPIFAGTDAVFGVGHSCFVKSPDESEWWHIYHAKHDRALGWRREIFAQPMSVDDRGRPLPGSPLPRGQFLDRPSGQTQGEAVLPLRAFTTDAFRRDDLRGWSYYGHHQFIKHTDTGIHLGRIPESPINDFRCGEKLVLDDTVSADFTAEVTIHFLGNRVARDAGLLFRCRFPAVGFDAQRAYFAGIIPRTGLVVLGKTDGSRWTELSRQQIDPDPAVPHTLQVRAVGDRISVAVDGETALQVVDDTWSSGSLGLRVVSSHAVFSNLKITAFDD